MTAGIKKNEFLGKLGANLPQDVSLPVVHAIVDNVDPILGVAFAKYEKYAEVSATGLRTVARTIPALHRHGLLRKQARHDGPPVLWLPEIMDMQANEALRRAAWLAQQKDENPQGYFTGRNGNVAECAHARRASEQAHDKIDVEGQPNTNVPTHSLDTGTQLESRQQRRAKAKSPVHADGREILRLVHGEWDARGLTLEDPEALSIAIHALGNSRPERIRHLDGRALRKAYQRARARLPQGYDRWVLLIEKWDKSYERRKARDLIDRLVTAVGDRPLGILDDLFDHLEQQICDHWPKKVRRLELEYSLLKNREYYLPQLRPLKTDAIKEQVYAALADGPKTKEELARMFGKTVGAISSVGLRLRNESKIRSIWQGDQFMWARASTVPRFIPARDAIVAVLKKGPMTIPELAQKTGKARSTVKSALHRHLLPREVIRTKFGTYALAGTEPLYISKRDAIIAALKEGPMTVRTLAQVTCTTLTSLYQFIDPLLENGKVIRIKHGTYALARTATVFIKTCDAIVRTLSKRAMRLGPLVQNINKSTNISRSRGTIATVLTRLKREGTVKQDHRGGEYRLARRKPPVRRGERVRGGSDLRQPALGEKEVPPSTIGSSFAARMGRRFKSYHSDQRNSGSADTAHKRVGRRVKLRQDSRGNYSSRKCIPDDVRAEYAGLYGPQYEVKFSAPASVGSTEAQRRLCEWAAEITSRFEAIRKTPRGESKDASIFEDDCPKPRLKQPRQKK
jgi:hypothetical protein